MEMEIKSAVETDAALTGARTIHETFDYNHSADGGGIGN